MAHENIYQFDVALHEDAGKLVWLGDAWGDNEAVPVFSCEGASLIEVLKDAIAKLEGIELTRK